MLYIFIILPLLWTFAQAQYGANCILPNRKIGLCMPLKSCKSTYEFIKHITYNGGRVSDTDRQKLYNLQCGRLRSDPLLCCDKSEIQLNPVGLDLLTNNTCGLEGRNRVSYGSEARLFGFPWMALLKFDDPIKPFKCGGSLIKYVLTAAHCINETKRPLTAVRLGEHRISTDQDCQNFGQKTVCSPPVEDVSIEEIIKHEDYERSIYHDIALLRLDRKVRLQQHIKTICLPIYDDLRTKEYAEYVIAGWGATEKERQSDVLQVAVVPNLNHGECQNQLGIMFRFRQTITKSQICTIGLNLIDTCKGDSGGPLGYKDFYNGKPRFIQFGVVSSGANSCGQIIAPSIYTNVSHYIQWITDNMY